MPNPARVHVGVALDAAPGNLGDWLAIGAAFDAAGAFALWIDVEPAPDRDPWTLVAALAAVTMRTRIVVALPAGPAHAVQTVDRLSRGRLAILADSPQPVLDDASYAYLRSGVESIERLGEKERWLRVLPPMDRAHWRSLLAQATERGADGLIVPAEPRLLDLLRNPEDPGERRDLQLAVG